MKKVLLIIPLTILTSLIPYLLSFTNFYDKIDPVQFNLYFYIVWTVLFLIGLLIITDILTVKEVFSLPSAKNISLPQRPFEKNG